MTQVDHFVSAEELMAFLDGELPFEQAAGIRAHVLACPECQRLAATLTAVSDHLAHWRVEPSPASLTAPPLAIPTVQASRRLPMWRPRSIAWTLAGVAAVAVVLVLPTQFSRSYGPPPASMSSPSAALPESAIVGGPSKRAVARSGEALTHASTPASQAADSSGGPSIARTARLTLTTNRFESVRTAVTDVVRDVGGLVTTMAVGGNEETTRHLNATLRIPAARLDEALTRLKSLEVSVVEEAQGAEDVTDEIVDVSARLANSRNTERRLNELLLTRTGSLDDVLAAERELARVREEIERLDGQKQRLDRRVSHAVLMLQLSEERKATLAGSAGSGPQFRNAIVDGLRFAYESVLGAAVFAVRILPALLVWALILAWPLRWLWRRGHPTAGV